MTAVYAPGMANSIYVIFRGSNDASQTTLESGHVANVNWRANLDNRMVLDGTFNGAPHMTQIDGFMVHNTATALLDLAGVDVQVIHHHPGLFMKKLMGGL